MTLCMHRGHHTKFSMGLLYVLLLSACSQTPITPAPTAAPTAPASTGLTLSKAYTLAQTAPSTIKASLYNFHQTQTQLQPQNTRFYRAQNDALGLVETYWELAIIHYALQRIWLVQKLLMPPVSSQDTSNNLATPTPRSQLGNLSALAATERQLSLHKIQLSHRLSQLTGITQTDYSLHHLPLSQLRAQLPDPSRLDLDQFAKRLLKQSYSTTYASLSSNYPNLKTLQYSQLYEDPILGQYVWSEILSSLLTNAQQLTPATTSPTLSKKIQLTQLNLALVNYHYQYQKMHSLQAQYQAAESHFRLDQRNQINGTVSLQSVYSLSIEAMAIHLIYLQATLDTVQAYAKLLASSHLAPSSWQQPFEHLSLARPNHSNIADIVDLAPASGALSSSLNSDHLVSITAYNDPQGHSANDINNLALEAHYNRSGDNAILSAAVEPYLWQVDIGANTAKTRAQAHDYAPALNHQLYIEHTAEQTSSALKTSRIKAKGLGHDRARELCTELKNAGQQCWVLQSEL